VPNLPTRRAVLATMNANVLKWVALSIFVLQNAGVVLMMKLSRNVSGVPYSTRVAVLTQEGVKLALSILLYTHETGGPLAALTAIRTDLRENYIEWLQLGIPALLYTVQNNALFVGLSNLDAAVAHVTYQTKILFTALFSIVLLGKRLGPSQWSGLGCLVLGVVCVQGLLDKLLAAYAGQVLIPILVTRHLLSPPYPTPTPTPAPYPLAGGRPSNAESGSHPGRAHGVDDRHRGDDDRCALHVVRIGLF